MKKALCLAGALVAAVLWVRAGSSRPAAPRAAADEAVSSETVGELRGQIAMLTARLDASERKVALQATAAPAERPPANVADEVALRRAAPFAAGASAEEELHLFDDYFTSIDKVRGRATDGPLVDRFSSALRADRPEAPDLRHAHVDLLDCGNGLCRVELTLPDAEAAARARTQVTAQVAELAPQASVFANDRHVSAYFATPGATLPPWPRTNVD